MNARVRKELRTMLHTTIQLSMEVLEKLNQADSYTTAESMLSDYWCLLSHDNCPPYFLQAVKNNLSAFITRINLSIDSQLQQQIQYQQVVAPTASAAHATPSASGSQYQHVQKQQQQQEQKE